MRKYRNFEDVLKEVGSLGFYQWFVYGVMQYSNVLQTVNQNYMTFGKIEPPYSCPKTENGTLVNKTSTPSCPNMTVCTLDEDEIQFYSQTLEWKHECSTSYVPMFIVSLQMLGIIPGALLFNYLIDNYGRKWSCHLLNAGVIVIALSSAFASNWHGFAAARFFIGFLFGGLFMVSVVTQMEIIKESDRMWIYALDCWGISNAVLALVAYLTGEWRKLIIASNVMCLPLLLLSFFVKESPRWLLQKGRYEEAADVLNHMAKWNRKKNVHVDAESLRHMLQVRRRFSTAVAPGQVPAKNKRYTFLDVFHTRQLTLSFFTLSYAWMATSCMSYGLVYQNTSYVGSPFVNYAIAAAFRVLTQVLVFVADKYLKIRRRLMYLISLGLVVGCLSSITIVTIVTDPGRNSAATVVRIIGLICSGLMSALWLIVYLLPIEIFPTVVRNIAMGGCSVLARIGAVVGPQLLLLKDYWLPTPFFAFTIVAIINFLTVFFVLPETSGTSLPDSLDDPLKKADDPEVTKIVDEDDETNEKAAAIT